MGVRQSWRHAGGRSGGIHRGVANLCGLCLPPHALQLADAVACMRACAPLSSATATAALSRLQACPAAAPAQAAAAAAAAQAACTTLYRSVALPAI